MDDTPFEPTPSPTHTQREAWLSGGSDLAMAALRLKPAALERFLLQLEFEGEVLTGFHLEELQDVLPLDQLQALMLARVPAEHRPSFAKTLARMAAEHGQAMASGMLFFVHDAGGTENNAPSKPRYRRNLNGVSAEPFDLAMLLDLEEENLLRVFGALLLPTELARHDWLPIFLNALEAMQLRHLTTPRQLAEAQRTLLVAGCFEQARTLAERYPKARLQTIPLMEDCRDGAPCDPSAWKPSDIGSGACLQRQTLDLSGTRWWIVGAITYSAQAEEAATGFSDDPAWNDALGHFGGWITLQLGHEPLAALSQWNSRHPRIPAWPAGHCMDWLLESWDLPNIVVTCEGKIVDTLRGWQNQQQAIGTMLARNGLMTPEK